ncbi:hypothetical protein M885DRAFT_503913 [Pelagophyceae sp. CCMP2097]|nr:hypothetical protein M885DRAFT_503913 [Pelagophyceae sp. CCMP2097]
MHPRTGTHPRTTPFQKALRGTVRLAGGRERPCKGSCSKARPRTQRGAVEEAAQRRRTLFEGASARRFARACGLLVVLARARRLAMPRVSKPSPALPRGQEGIFTLEKHGPPVQGTIAKGALQGVSAIKPTSSGASLCLQEAACGGGRGRYGPPCPPGCP